MATKPVHEYTRAKIPYINLNCGLNILTETVPEPLGKTSPWTSKSTWTPIWTTEPTTTLFNRRPRPKPILEISNENLSEDLTIQTTQLTNQLTTQLMTQLTADVHKPLPEKCCGSKEEEQLDQSSSHFKIMYDLKTFVIHFILIILCFI